MNLSYALSVRRYLVIMFILLLLNTKDLGIKVYVHIVIYLFSHQIQ